MKRLLKIFHFFVLIACIILQLTFVEHLNIFGINIDLILVAITGIAIFDDIILAIIYGFFAGLFIDLVSGNIIGISALIYAISGFMTGSLVRVRVFKKIINYILIIFLITEINLLLLSGAYYLFGFDISFRELGLDLVINPIFNILAMLLLFPVLRAGRRRKEEIGFIYYKDKI